MPKKSSGSVKVYYPKYDREELLALLKERLAELAESMPIKLAVLFGSYAEGRQTAASDIDLFIVIEGDRDEAYRKIYDKLCIDNLELHLYTVEEYERMKEGRFVKEVSKGIRILGDL